MTTTIHVGGDREYDVLVGRNLTAELPGLLPKAAQAAVCFAGPVRQHAERVAAALGEGGIRPLLVEVPDAERGKDIGVAAHCWDVLGEAAFTRTDAVVGVGGGAVTDLAGFVAATWLRGVRLVNVPTSLLGMVDAAVGGKTGINTAAGKNLVGAFHPPAGVLCDLSTLDTLADEDLRAGMAEVIKCGFIADPVILELVEGDLRRHLPEFVERAVRVKATVVSQDLRESGLREILNYGHTLGHAIERHEGYRWKHGHAISVGMVFAAALGRRCGRLDGATADRHRRILARIGLPTSYTGGTFEQLHDAMRVDKKSRGATLRFVILDGLAKPSILTGPSDAMLRAAYDEVGS